MLGVEDLANLRSTAKVQGGWSIYKAMEHDPLYQRLEEALLGPRGEAFRVAYHRFVADVIAPAFGEPILYQACPTVRLFFADAPGEARFHRDADYGHDRAEVNFWVPLTPASTSNSIWIESAAGKDDHSPVALEPGEFIRFDGASLSHGAVANDSGRSRVSFDFRAIAQSASGPRELAGHGKPQRLDAHLFTRPD
jgi:ectoine hydroxylase-related dioxygenase (phytanoyl-CoA dioxygenase family)